MSKGKSKKYLKLENGTEYDKTVIIHESIPPVETTLDDIRVHYGSIETPPATNWVKKVRQIYYADKKPRSKVIVGIDAESDPESTSYLLKICIGSHCLFHFTEIYSSGYCDEPLPKDLVSLLLDSKTVVASAKPKEMEEKLMETFKLRLPRVMDLNKEAAVSVGLAGDRFRRYGLMKLAKMVLGGLDWDAVWLSLRDGDDRSTVSWWEDLYEEKLSPVKVKCGTFQAFLAYEMGVKLLANQ